MVDKLVEKSAYLKVARMVAQMAAKTAFLTAEWTAERKVALMVDSLAFGKVVWKDER